MHIYNTMSDEQSLGAATTETMLQLITPATRRAAILGFTLAFAGVTASDVSALVEFLIQTTAGTSGAATPEPLDRADPPALVTALKGFSGAEPTSGAIIRRLRVTPVGGLVVYHFPMDQIIKMLISTRVGMRVTAPQAQANVTAELLHQE
jgi:hypothetical protein